MDRRAAPAAPRPATTATTTGQRQRREPATVPLLLPLLPPAARPTGAVLMARVELHRGEDVVIVDADEPLQHLTRHARRLLRDVSPARPPSGPAVGFSAERRPEFSLGVPPVCVREEG